MFNPVSRIILKWLRHKFVSWRHDVQPCTANGLGLFDCWVSIVGISLAKSTMATIAYCGIVLLLGYFLQQISVCDTVLPVLSGSSVTMAWRVLGLRIEETASRYGG
jgi:hypothetical protein